MGQFCRFRREKLACRHVPRGKRPLVRVVLARPLSLGGHRRGTYVLEGGQAAHASGAAAAARVALAGARSGSRWTSDGAAAGTGSKWHGAEVHVASSGKGQTSSRPCTCLDVAQASNATYVHVGTHPWCAREIYMRTLHFTLSRSETLGSNHLASSHLTT
jgi:hypothetical protein